VISGLRLWLGEADRPGLILISANAKTLKLEYIISVACRG